MNSCNPVEINVDVNANAMYYATYIHWCLMTSIEQDVGVMTFS